MYATIRHYEANSALADQLVARADDVRAIITGIEGFNAYYLIRTDDGTVSITVFDDKSGAEESNTAAAGWIRENMPEVAASPPKISSGEVALSI